MSLALLPANSPAESLNTDRASIDRTFEEVMSQALPCRTADPELWFAEQTAKVEQAKTLCGECPMRTACLTGALERCEPWGVWGGEVFVDGVVVAQKRGRGRPRKRESPPVLAA